MRTGLYEIFTVFIFILVLLLVLFLALFLSGNAAILKSKTGDAKLASSVARSAFDTITQCHGQQVLNEGKIEECRNVAQFVKAVKIMQSPIDGCAEKIWGEIDYAVATSDSTVESYSYWLGIQQTDTPNVCLAQLIIAI